MVPDVPLPTKHLKQLLKAVAGIALGHLCQHLDTGSSRCVSGWYSSLTADIFDSASGFDGLQNGDDLVFSESDLAHSDLLRGHSQYVGRSLKVNGSFKRDTYILARSAKGIDADHHYLTNLQLGTILLSVNL
ncbi:hypothetical protein D3C81_428990 [compost metagenome]